MRKNNPLTVVIFLPKVDSCRKMGKNYLFWLEKCRVNLCTLGVSGGSVPGERGGASAETIHSGSGRMVGAHCLNTPTPCSPCEHAAMLHLQIQNFEIAWHVHTQSAYCFLCVFFSFSLITYIVNCGLNIQKMPTYLMIREPG